MKELLEKRCTACGEYKPLSAFYTAHGIPISWCKVCSSRHAKEWRKAHPTTNTLERAKLRRERRIDRAVMLNPDYVPREPRADFGTAHGKGGRYKNINT